MTHWFKTTFSCSSSWFIFLFLKPKKKKMKTSDFLHGFLRAIVEWDQILVFEPINFPSQLFPVEIFPHLVVFAQLFTHQSKYISVHRKFICFFSSHFTDSFVVAYSRENNFVLQMFQWLRSCLAFCWLHKKWFQNFKCNIAKCIAFSCKVAFYCT